jgi:hypothetical protein
VLGTLALTWRLIERPETEPRLIGQFASDHHYNITPTE